MTSSSWKIARVISLFKKSPLYETFNHIPISLASLAYKAMDVIVREPLYDHFVRNILSGSNLFGFLKRSPTVVELLGLND